MKTLILPAIKVYYKVTVIKTVIWAKRFQKDTLVEQKSRNRLTHTQLPTYAAHGNAKLYSQYGKQFDYFSKN